MLQPNREDTWPLSLPMVSEGPVSILNPGTLRSDDSTVMPEAAKARWGRIALDTVSDDTYKDAQNRQGKMRQATMKEKKPRCLKNSQSLYWVSKTKERNDLATVSARGAPNAVPSLYNNIQEDALDRHLQKSGDQVSRCVNIHPSPHNHHHTPLPHFKPP